MDGLTLAKRVKKINYKVNIIFLTVCDEKKACKRGAQDQAERLSIEAGEKRVA